MEGYIKLHRKIMENPIWQDPDLFRLWMFCLMKASYKERTVLVDKQEVQLSPGQFVTGRFSLHKEFNQGIPPRKQAKDTTLWSWLKKLEKIGNIDIKSYNKYSVVTVVNWCLYQETLTTESQQNDNEITTESQQNDTNKNVNKGKESKESKEGKENNISSQIENLRQRYSHNQLKIIDDYLEMIRHTRVSAKISENVILGMYREWDKHPSICVEYGLKTHTENPNYHSRKENYTYGIIRNTTADEAVKKLNQKGVKPNGSTKSDYAGYNFDKERELTF